MEESPLKHWYDGYATIIPLLSFQAYGNFHALQSEGFKVGLLAKIDYSLAYALPWIFENTRLMILQNGFLNRNVVALTNLIS